MEPGPSRVTEPGPSRVTESEPSEICEEVPSWVCEAGTISVCEQGPSRISEPGSSRVSEPRPGSRWKSDEELLLEHGITRECKVVLSSAFVSDHGDSSGQPPQMSPPRPTKEFRVHYGRHFLWHLAHLHWRNPVIEVDMDRLYSTFITSEFCSLDRDYFQKVLHVYVNRWKKDMKDRRAQLIKEKIIEVNARRKAEWEAQRETRRRFKITYRNQSVIVPLGSVKEAKIALRDVRKSQVVLERINVDDAPTDATNGNSGPPDDVPVGSPQSATDVSESHCNTAPSSVSGDVEDSSELPGSSSSAISCSLPPCLFKYLGNEKKEDRRTAITGLITDMIAKVSDEQDHDGGASNPDMSSTDCYSDDTVESPMEVDFLSGESPDFSKVLRDSEETCHGDEFYEDAAANQQSLPNSNADKGSQKTITKSPDKSIGRKKSMKL